ncbi:FCD domain-containing protein [Nocardioides sp.]|uniref:FCD domain-containing protein n=1 Tax=Nocardioides sp. TaxID=35761 RepID=UPI0035270DE6
MRRRLEPLTLILSLENLHDEQVEEMADLEGEIEANTDTARFLALDRDFHMASYATCRASSCPRRPRSDWRNSTFTAAGLELAAPTG